MSVATPPHASGVAQEPAPGRAAPVPASAAFRATVPPFAGHAHTTRDDLRSYEEQCYPRRPASDWEQRVHIKAYAPSVCKHAEAPLEVARRMLDGLEAVACALAVAKEAQDPTDALQRAHLCIDCGTDHRGPPGPLQLPRGHRAVQPLISLRRLTLYQVCLHGALIPPELVAMCPNLTHLTVDASVLQLRSTVVAAPNAPTHCTSLVSLEVLCCTIEDQDGVWREDVPCPQLPALREMTLMASNAFLPLLGEEGNGAACVHTNKLVQFRYVTGLGRPFHTLPSTLLAAPSAWPKLECLELGCRIDSATAWWLVCLPALKYLTLGTCTEYDIRVDRSAGSWGVEEVTLLGGLTDVEVHALGRLPAVPTLRLSRLGWVSLSNAGAQLLPAFLARYTEVISAEPRNGDVPFRAITPVTTVVLMLPYLTRVDLREVSEAEKSPAVWRAAAHVARVRHLVLQTTLQDVPNTLLQTGCVLHAAPDVMHGGLTLVLGPKPKLLVAAQDITPSASCMQLPPFRVRELVREVVYNLAAASRYTSEIQLGNALAGLEMYLSARLGVVQAVADDLQALRQALRYCMGGDPRPVTHVLRIRFGVALEEPVDNGDDGICVKHCPCIWPRDQPGPAWKRKAAALGWALGGWCIAQLWRTHLH